MPARHPLRLRTVMLSTVCVAACAGATRTASGARDYAYARASDSRGALDGAAVMTTV